MFQLVDWYGHVGDATVGRAARGKDAHLTGHSIIYIIKQLTQAADLPNASTYTALGPAHGR
ncbi:hypothetical protein PS9374_04619 [Planomonospora sphaerica]|uniref:Uncharacterized protein n=1 Tax=Planomonospora sphaerica TaxID=161355 RepID=A0A161LJ92_9ACTN|nr:hypothetical protein [Planomonospora sphaerica]GAT68954.1 hypothetical protein PS9374_04619 [Planomonospora sphaerica]